MLEFKSLEEPEIIEMHRRQNSDSSYELSALLNNEPPWIPMTLAKVKEAIDGHLKKDRNTVFALYDNNVFIGIGAWSSSWDPRGPWNYVIIWPEHRRKGHGRAAAEMLLERTFLDSPAHAIDSGVPGWNKPAIAFLKSMGFRDAGRIRLSGIRDGVYYDEIMFDMLKSEYLARLGEVEE